VIIDELLHVLALEMVSMGNFYCALIAFNVETLTPSPAWHQGLVVDDVGLANLAQAIKDGVGQFAPFISDLKRPSG